MRKAFVVVVLALLAAAVAAVPVSVSAQPAVSASDIAARDHLIAAQETLLNAYRCMFNADTEQVQGGCDSPDTIAPGPAPQNPTQNDLDVRDQLIAAQETLLNAYRCRFGVDTQLVAGGCGDTEPEPPTAPAATTITVPPEASSGRCAAHLTARVYAWEPCARNVPREYGPPEDRLVLTKAEAEALIKRIWAEVDVEGKPPSPPTLAVNEGRPGAYFYHHITLPELHTFTLLHELAHALAHGHPTVIGCWNSSDHDYWEVCGHNDIFRCVADHLYVTYFNIPSAGVCGTFSSVHDDAPATSAPDGKFTAISTGRFHSCGIRADGTVACWGLNRFGRADAPDGEFTAVSAGGGDSCAIRGNQTVVCWGYRTDAPDGKFTAISTGSSHSCAIRADRTIACWGDNWLGEATAPDGQFTNIAAGGNHSCGIRADRTVACWGDNKDGQTDAPEGQFTDIAAGVFHSCAIRADQTVACWGVKRNGRADALEGQFTDIAAGRVHSCAIRANRTIACWGDDKDGQTDPPEGQFTTVSASYDYSCAIRADRTIACWGNNEDG